MKQRHRAPALAPHALLAVSLIAGCSSGGGDPTPGELAVSAATAAALVGPDNDVVTVTFASNVVEAQVVNPANWDVEHPIGTPFDLTGATIDYDPTTFVATVTLGPGTVGSLANGNNLQTRESIRVTWNGVTGVAGGNVTGEPSVVVTGDTTEPNILSVSADGVETTLRIEFDEWTRQIGFGELYTGTPGDPGPRFRLIDADGTPAVPATGTVTIASQPNDGDTIALDDGTRQVLFEFDDNASVVNAANLRGVVIGLDEIETAAHLTTAINDPGFTFDIEAAHSTTVAEGVNLSNPVAGANGNTVIQTSNPAALTVVGFTGGVDAEPLVREPVGGGFAWDADGTGATIDFAPAIPDPANDSIEIYGVRDLAGNQVFAEASFPLTAADPSEPAPLGTSAFIAQGGVIDDVIRVEFAAPMSPVHLLEPANYSTSPALDLSTARFERVDANTVVIRLPAGQNVQASTTYDLTLVANPATPLATSNGIELTANATIAIPSSGDNSPLSAGSARAFLVGASDPNSVFIEYVQPVKAVGALVAANYALNAAAPLDVTPVGSSIVRLAFASPPAISDVIDIEPAAAVDLAGNVPVGVISLAVEGPDVTAPVTFFIEGLVVFDRAPDILEAVFSERLDPALATDLGNYSVSQNGAPIDLEGATIEYRDYSEATVQISLSEGVHLIRGATLEWSVSGLADPFGNAVAPASDTSIIQGDSEVPDLEAGFVNWIADPSGQTVDLRFSRHVVESYVETVENWSTDLFTQVVAAELISPNVVRLTLAGQLGAQEVIQIADVPNLAGEESFALTIDPVE